MTTYVERGKATGRGRLLRIAVVLGVVVALAAGLSAMWLYTRLHASLPRLEGELALPGLAALVRVERDARGVPIVRGSDRLDVARATGFLHAQERFFQMDLLRRRAAGELAELFGEAALEADREVRVFRLRAVARRALDAARPDERNVLEAYAEEGVNGGLDALGAAPFEYLLLGEEPRAWRAEDSPLCALAMFLTLQGGLPRNESALAVMHELLPPELAEFLSPRGTEWDAPLEGEPFVQPPVPGPEVLDLRRSPRAVDRLSAAAAAPVVLAGPEEAVVAGSDNWAVAGTHTIHGGALWPTTCTSTCRSRTPGIEPRSSGPGGDGDRRASGVTLPGGAPRSSRAATATWPGASRTATATAADLVAARAPTRTTRTSYRTPAGPAAARARRPSRSASADAADATARGALRLSGSRVVDRGPPWVRRRALRWVPHLDGRAQPAALARLEPRAPPLTRRSPPPSGWRSAAPELRLRRSAPVGSAGPSSAASPAASASTAGGRRSWADGAPTVGRLASLRRVPARRRPSEWLRL